MINPKKPSLKRVWMRVHRDIQNLFYEREMEPTSLKRGDQNGPMEREDSLMPKFHKVPNSFLKWD